MTESSLFNSGRYAPNNILVNVDAVQRGHGSVGVVEGMRSIPCTEFGIDLDAATMAYRVVCVMDDEAIDYSYRMDDCVGLLMDRSV